MPKIAGFHTKAFDGRHYHLYTTFNTKRKAVAEAERMRRVGHGKVWLVRVIKSQYGYDLWTTQKALKG